MGCTSLRITFGLDGMHTSTCAIMRPFSNDLLNLGELSRCLSFSSGPVGVGGSLRVGVGGLVVSAVGGLAGVVVGGLVGVVVGGLVRVGTEVAIGGLFEVGFGGLIKVDAGGLVGVGGLVAVGCNVSNWSSG